MSNTTSEFILYFKYLSGQMPSETQIKQYIHGIETLELQLNEKEYHMQQWILANPLWLRAFDAGLNSHMKKSSLKKRIVLVAAIMECDPKFFNHFFNQTIIKFKLFQLILLALKSSVYIALGYTLFKVKGWK
jgi:hypothetical protein